jgi:hypothetical protein
MKKAMMTILKHTPDIVSRDLPVETDEMLGKASFFELFGLSEVPSIRFFGDKIINEKDFPDAEFCRCFMYVILGAFLCPNSSTKPSTKYMGALVDVDKTKDRNWVKFAYDWFICYVTKYLKERSKQTRGTITLGGFIYHTAVRYLDASIKLPPTLPRIRVWKGKLIKLFSELDKGEDGNYGSYIIKKFSQTCYAAPTFITNQMDVDHSIFKAKIEKAVGERFTEQVNDEIFQSFQSHMIHSNKEAY